MLAEMIHDARVIPIDGSSHLDSSIRQLHGDSRGHWEGDTLVIETTNYSATGIALRPWSKGLHVTERITRVGPKTLNYEVTINDPEIYTMPWTALIPLDYSEEPIFEYACHEGNIGMEGILAGHRTQEREAAVGTGASGSK